MKLTKNLPLIIDMLHHQFTLSIHYQITFCNPDYHLNYGEKKQHGEPQVSV